MRIDKYFRQFDTLQEVYNSLKVIIQNNNLSIVKNDELMKIKILNSTINKEFFIVLKPKEKNIKEELNNLAPLVFSLNKRIENLEKEKKILRIKLYKWKKTIRKKYFQLGTK